MVVDKYLSCDYNTIIEKTGDYQPPAEKVYNRSYDNFDNHLTPQWKLCAKNEKYYQYVVFNHCFSFARSKYNSIY